MRRLSEVLKETKALLAALAANSGATNPIQEGELHYYAWHIIGGYTEELVSYIDFLARKERYEAVHASTSQVLDVLDALSDAEREHLFIGEAEIDALSLLSLTAYRLAQQEPPIRRRGRRPNRGALGIAERASFAYEMVANKRPTITVDSDTSEAGGAFLILVEDLFRLMSMDVSAEHYARRALKNDVPGTADEASDG